MLKWHLPIISLCWSTKAVSPPSQMGAVPTSTKHSLPLLSSSTRVALFLGTGEAGNIVTFITVLYSGSETWARENLLSDMATPLGVSIERKLAPCDTAPSVQVNLGTPVQNYPTNQDKANEKWWVLYSFHNPYSKYRLSPLLASGLTSLETTRLLSLKF